MPKYVLLLNWTEQGVKNVKDTVDRYHAARQLVESKGGKFDAIYWTAGPYDIVSVVDAPNDEAAAAATLQLAAAGNLKTLSMRAFDEDEMKSVIGQMG